MQPTRSKQIIVPCLSGPGSASCGLEDNLRRRPRMFSPWEGKRINTLCVSSFIKQPHNVKRALSIVKAIYFTSKKIFDNFRHMFVIHHIFIYFYHQNFDRYLALVLWISKCPRYKSSNQFKIIYFYAKFSIILHIYEYKGIHVDN